MPKGVPNKKYTPEFKTLVIETMQKERLSYRETAQRFEVNDHHRIQDWERIYLTEGPEGFAVERRGRSSKGRPLKELPKEVEEDLLAEVQRLRAEADYLKNCKPWSWKTSDASGKTLVVQELRQKHSLEILLSIAQLPRVAFCYHLKRMNRADKHKAVKEEMTAIYHENNGRSTFFAGFRSFLRYIRPKPGCRLMPSRVSRQTEAHRNSIKITVDLWWRTTP